MELIKLTPQELKDQELVKLHETLLENYMKTDLRWNLKRRNTVKDIHKKLIDIDNIRYFINRPIDLFLKALLLNKLDLIKNYNPEEYTCQS